MVEKYHSRVTVNENTPGQEVPFQPHYECHITTEPLYDKSYELKALEMATGFGFRFAKLYKRVDVAGQTGWEESRIDSFCTGRGDSYDGLLVLGKQLCKALIMCGVHVRRMKIEQVMYDKRDLR